MNRLLRNRLVCALLIAGILAGCGQKGPLYLPEKKKAKVPSTQQPQDAQAPQPQPPQLPEPSTPAPSPVP
jgi:predicted small lipoprotein YifL